MKPPLTLLFDGLCEPINPGGCSCYGWHVRERLDLRGSGVVHRSGKASTNNVAEYYALGYGLRALVDLGLTDHEIVVLGDSQLVIKQVTFAWRCNAPHLIRLRDRCRELLAMFPIWQAKWIPREQNEEADRLSQQAYENATGCKVVPRVKRAKHPDWW